jgi:hypothetical protein
MAAQQVQDANQQGVPRPALPPDPAQQQQAAQPAQLGETTQQPSQAQEPQQDLFQNPVNRSLPLLDLIISPSHSRPSSPTLQSTAASPRITSSSTGLRPSSGALLRVPGGHKLAPGT